MAAGTWEVKNTNKNTGSSSPTVTSRVRALFHSARVIDKTRPRFTGSYPSRFRRYSINRNLVFVPIRSNPASAESIASLIAIFSQHLFSFSKANRETFLFHEEIASKGLRSRKDE